MSKWKPYCREEKGSHGKNNVVISDWNVLDVLWEKQPSFSSWCIYGSQIPPMRGWRVVNFNPSMDKWLHLLWSVGWNHLSIPKHQQCSHWSLRMDKQFHPTLNQACDYLSMQALKLNHVIKMCHWNIGPGKDELEGKIKLQLKPI